MRTSAALLMAALALPAAALTAPAFAQTQGQTYAVGPSDFMPSETTTGRAARGSAGDPASYENENAPRRSRVIDCGRSADPRCFEQ